VLVMIPGAQKGSPASARPYRLVDERSAQLLVTDLAATRGDGVFETVGVFDGKPVNLDAHLARLARSAAMIDLPELALDTIRAAAISAIDAHLPVPELALKIIVTRGVEGDGVLTAWAHARAGVDYGKERAGIKVVALDRGIPTTAPATSPWLLAGAKTLSYAVNMAVVREAARRGADDVLFVSSDGYALEGPTSTLLVRHGDRFVSTPADAGVLPGTSLTTAFEFLRGSGYEVAEELVTPRQVAESDGAWLLSSVRLAAPLTHLDDEALPVDAGLSRQLSRAISGRV
jgi:4-amino-4-deoxychorismate lyase